MTERDITGQIKRASLNRLPALLGIDDEALTVIADRVRQFDNSQSDDTRQRKALEKVALLIGQSTLIESSSDRFTRHDQRSREVKALELMAVAQAYPHEALRESVAYRVIADSLGVPKKTREQGETRD
ncbi:hypothetical protein ACFWPU_01120 [Streptomyces sp. NPDC058471]|uniref:hypothetical protein n=1 Tax=Streptomyces sp. NPDC058471 TaxID=3346516 RepID=UPI003668D082